MNTIPFEDHKIIATNLKMLKNQLSVMLKHNYKNKKEQNNSNEKKAIKCVDELRDLLDNVMYDNESDKTDEELSNIYYGQREREDQNVLHR